MKNRFTIFILALLLKNPLQAYNNQYANYHSFDTPNFSYSVNNLITYIAKKDAKNSNKYKDISDISSIISGILKEIWISTINPNKNQIISSNSENVKSLLYKKLSFQLNNKLKNFKFNVSYVGKNHITTSFTHTVKTGNSNSSDYTIYFIFKNNKLFCKIINSDIYKVIVLRYNVQNNNFEEFKEKYVPHKSGYNNLTLKNPTNMPNHIELYNTIFKIIETSNTINNRNIIAKSSKHIANKIYDVIQILKQQNNNRLEQNENIQKTIWEILKNSELENIEIYDYSTDINNINICFSINKVYQISLVICNTNITLVCWNIMNGTMNMLMFYKEKQKFRTISLNELEKINLIPSETSVKELILNVMNAKKIPHEYINNYIISIPTMLNCIKALLSTNNSIKTDKISEIHDLKNLKQILFRNNIDLKINSQQINNSKATTFCFFIKDIFSVKFIVTEDSSKSSLELCLSKLLPSNTYQFDPQSQKFKEKLNKNNNLFF